MGSLIDGEGSRGMGRLGSHRVHGKDSVISVTGSPKPKRETRTCVTPECDTVLSQYNSGSLCGPCMYKH